ncbi:ubiquinol-cytochrome C reductase hinge protein-domain-containing protein [Mariannaea sp. PMI_226]|nr:ubiquinol-cytochrome C reductase hinge protein-domain-containing protein [Mariannaea sp. PMI_226]
MGIWDAFSDIVEAVTPWSVVEAEAPVEEPKEEQPETETKESADEPEDVLEEECRNSAQCAPAKHHFDECVERVQQQESEGGAKEDCVEEFFHLAHCATACAAPKLWSKLK